MIVVVKCLQGQWKTALSLQVNECKSTICNITTDCDSVSKSLAPFQ